MSFRSVFIALVLSFGMILAGLLINGRRPAVETIQPNASFVRATGKCASCHTRTQHSIVHEFELSEHAKKGVTCLDCHQTAEGQTKEAHHGFEISKTVTSANCRSCHETQYQQFLRSRHAAPSWAAVYGEKGLTADQVAFSEKFHPGACKRAANALVSLEGQSAVTVGCVKCHSVGRPNPDGTIGSCTACHTRHTSSVEIARLPTTCGQCHMGPDHSQLEIYNESKHGVMFAAQKSQLKLDAPAKSLTTQDMFVPTCTTCHMSGLNGLKSTHDTSERLSYWLADEISKKRPNAEQAQVAMKEVCNQCHTQRLIDQIYEDASKVVESTNEKVKATSDIMTALRKEGVLGPKRFETPIDFMYFDLWHYYGRTTKHGAFMGGQDFAQWHGAYPMLKHSVEIKAQAEELRRAHGNATAK
ncbi:Seven times multi-haem cytochrome CxxCH [Singulisphaera sp. GP187]|uniref:multiheme c-type cytochrome n=1 Tax=Singulisphaera sp. GP187 TaxID=1882752 RepID=UPI00092AD8ED|nr:multiheme c-type cytochrome [Singulisphaera sp. GP187]SIN71226.1 Seven times multi-haem cytochrome CxxCH [Singulisphaera sp. GP187]